MKLQVQTLNKKRFKSLANSILPVLVIVAVCIPMRTMAGTDTTFDNIVTMVSGWLEGSLGKVLALVGLAIALGAGLVKGSITGVIVGLGIALAAVYGPGVITSMFSATF